MMRLFQFTGIALAITINAHGQMGNQSLFGSDEILSVTIACNLRELINDTDEKTASYHSGILSYFDADSTNVSVEVELKTRGIFRKSKENCTFPPVMVKFKGQRNDSDLFSGQKKLKLVTTCRNRNPRFEQFVVKEYLAYRMYNMLTEYSFRVRLLRVNFIDLQQKIRNFTTIAFLIESERELAKRNGLSIMKNLGIHQEAVDHEVITTLSIFQYMIGNTDWSVPKLHNIKLFLKDPAKSPIAVPYDFDFCGLVDPPYTKPPENLPIKHVTERIYRGFCEEPELLEPLLNNFLKRKGQFYNLVWSNTLLSPSSRKRVLRYLDEFYAILSSERLKNIEFYQNCRKN